MTIDLRDHWWEILGLLAVPEVLTTSEKQFLTWTTEVCCYPTCPWAYRPGCEGGELIPQTHASLLGLFFAAPSLKNLSKREASRSVKLVIADPRSRWRQWRNVQTTYKNRFSSAP